MKTVGRNIRSLRTSKGISRKEFAKMAGISGYTVINVEIGRQDDILTSSMLRIANALGVKIDDLLEK